MPGYRLGIFQLGNNVRFHLEAYRAAFLAQGSLVVLHDLPTGAMSGLERFIGAARDRGATFAQDFPASCIPIERGRLQAPIDLYMTRASG